MIHRTWRSCCRQRAAVACLLRCVSRPHPRRRCLHDSRSLSPPHAAPTVPIIPHDAASPSHLSPPSSACASPLSPPGASASQLDSRPDSASRLSAAEQAERDRCVAAHLHRQQRLQTAMRNTDRRHLRIAFDLSFASAASASASSLATQLSFVVACNRQAEHPACIFLTSLDPRLSSDKQQKAAAEQAREEGAAAADGLQELEDEGALQAERPFAFQMLKRGATSWMVNRSSLPVNAIFSREECLYLSPDAPQPLWRLSPDTALVVGGIVDRTAVVKSSSLQAAMRLRLRAVRLPIRECLPGGLRKTALNVDLVFALLLHVHQAAETQRRLRLRQQEEQRAAQQPQPSASSSSSSLPAPPLSQLVNGDADSGIDWCSLWCRAFDELIPKRLRWSEEELSSKQERLSRGAARKQPPQRRSAVTA